MVIPLTHQRQNALIRCAKQGATPPPTPSPYEGEGAMASCFITSAQFACKKTVCQVYNHNYKCSKSRKYQTNRAKPRRSARTKLKKVSP